MLPPAMRNEGPMPTSDYSREELQTRVQAAYLDKSLLQDPSHAQAVAQTVALLDRGELRVAEPILATLDGSTPEAGEAGGDDWIVHAWVKQAVLLFFAIQRLETIEVGPFEYLDKIPLKKN